MIRTFLRGCVLIAAILAIHTPTSPGQQREVPTYQDDPRAQVLREFFEALNSPAGPWVQDFLYAADRHGLDWRLLPSIAILESGAGREFTNNNIFGWDSCRTGFSSVRESIHFVASRLAGSNLYKGRDLTAKLALYNPHPDYPGRVRWLMGRLEARLLDAAAPRRTARDYSNILTPKNNPAKMTMDSKTTARISMTRSLVVFWLLASAFI
jgi:hypothetical protein